MVARMVPHGSRAFAKGTEVVLGGPNPNVRKLSWGWGQSTGKEIVLGRPNQKVKDIVFGGGNQKARKLSLGRGGGGDPIKR